MSAPLRVGVLVSGAGTTLDALAESAPQLGASVVVVIADRPGVPALEVAARRSIPSTVVPMQGEPPRDVAKALDAALRPAGVELVVLAGLRSILPVEWLTGWIGRVVNVHPSLLPRHGGAGHYGRRVYESILSARDLESGATVHLVTADVDAGPVLLQERFRVPSGSTPESLQAQTQLVERRLLRETVARFAAGRWRLPYRPSGARDDSARGPAGRT
ncbi:MAG: phosphoribosylglycinamide formyltransferase [Thermoplasmata archaeon]|nr:phosphoribosylglycinamide formyltransferase [Thermoplasmata archaeon]MCI4355706.1 phosphoribosylglycinamide formyltransferase [Thermoplasmata archaeon]